MWGPCCRIAITINPTCMEDASRALFIPDKTVFGELGFTSLVNDPRSLWWFWAGWIDCDFVSASPAAKPRTGDPFPLTLRVHVTTIPPTTEHDGSQDDIYAIPCTGGNYILDLTNHKLSDAAYVNGRYADDIDYTENPRPALTDPDAEWADGVLREQGLR